MMLAVEKTIKKFKFLLFGVFFAGTVCFLLWKCQYGYANIDEAFYLTIPYRMIQGDGLILHEWHLSQLSGLLLYPAVSLYLLIIGGTEGILFHFRILFTLCWAAGAVFLLAAEKVFCSGSHGGFPYFPDLCPIWHHGAQL